MNFLMNNKKAVIAATVILSVLVGLGTTRLRMDSSISAVLPTEDADYLYNNQISEDFGNSQEIIILLTSENSVYTEGNLNLIQEITLYLKDQKEIQSITAILQQYNPESETLEINSGTIASIERRIDNNPLAVNQIVDPEKKITLIRAPLTVDAANNEQATSKFIAEMKTDIGTMLEEARESDNRAFLSDFNAGYQYRHHQLHGHGSDCPFPAGRFGGHGIDSADAQKRPGNVRSPGHHAAERFMDLRNQRHPRFSADTD